MVAAAGALVSVGYQGRQLDDLLAELDDQSVTAVADVRLNPVSRRYGFAKTRLTAALAEVGITYLHLRQLGNPIDNRAGFADQHGDAGAAARERYRLMMLEPTARAALRMLADRSAVERVGVFCFEADGSACHRALVIEEALRLTAEQAQNSESFAASLTGG